MKKIIAVLLALTLALSCFGMMLSCGGEEEPEKTELELFAEAVKNSATASVTAVITTKRDGVTLTANTTLNATTNTVEYQVLSSLDINQVPTDMTVTETLTAKSGENTIDVAALSLVAANLTDVAIANGTLTAKVSNPSALFGTTITTFTTADITVTMTDNVLTAITVSYTTTAGSAVTIVTTIS